MSKVTVFGSFVVDLITRSECLPQKGQTIFATDFEMGAGGKGQNQAVQSHLMGCETEFICKVGQDELSAIGKNFWISIGLKPLLFESAEGKTGCANISVEASGQNQIAVFLGANNCFKKEEVECAMHSIANSDLLLMQSEVNIEAIDWAAELATKAGVPIVYNPAPYRPLTADFMKQLFLITPNETEAAALVGVDKVDTENCLDVARRICAMGPKNCIITLGENGCCHVSNEVAKIYPTVRVKAVDTVGAGDSFNGALVAMLAKKKPFEEAIRYALAAGSLSVLSKGSAVSMKGINAVEAFMRENSITE